VGTGSEGAADVTWYHFQLQEAARVDLSMAAPPGDRPFEGVLSLYNSDPQDWSDPYDPNGHLLLAQVQSDPTDGLAFYSQDLGPGHYYVAVSGAGNTAFSPVIAGSGYPGAIGIYELTAAATDLGLAGDGPTMLWATPAAGAVLDSSPLAIRVELSAPIDPGTVAAGQTVQLFQVSGGVETQIPLASTNVSTPGDELQLFPAAPLAPGQYVVQLSGNSLQDPAVLADPNDVPLGEDVRNPEGADESFSFQVDGIDGVAGATASDDTPATARDLGDVVGAGIVQVAGAIGVDPNLSADPANQVDLYHFQISGLGRYMMLAEVFAGRIGSPLAPGLSLFELDPSTGQLDFLTGDVNTLNPTEGTDGTLPLFLDSALSDGLTAGDYYLAVADGSNTPAPIENQAPGSPGLFDPNQPGSTQNGWSTGPYQLNLRVLPSPDPPQVVASSPAPGQVLDQAPAQITVQFSEPVDLQQLAYQAFEASNQATLPQVFIEGADGTTYEPRFVSYDRTTNTATFEMLDQLPDGSYTLDLSGPGGITDLAGNLLPANDPSGDYLIPFSVDAPTPALPGSMSGGFWTIAQAGAGAPQDFGLLFAHQLQAGVSILRYPESPDAPGASATQDQFVVTLPELQGYGFQLIGNDLPAGVQVSLSDASGPVGLAPAPGNSQLFVGLLSVGTYTVTVGGWPVGAGASLSYQLLITMGAQYDNPPALVDGPSPLLQVSFATTAATSGASPAGEGVLPGGSGAVPGPVADTSVGPIGGGVVAVATLGGSGPATPTGATVLGSSQAEAAIGLAGLGMGPLGGSGGLAGPASSATVQVALNAPSSAATPSGAFAVGLVTLTQMFSWTSEGQGVGPVEEAEPPVVATNDPPEEAEAVAAGPEFGPSVGIAAAVATPTNPTGPVVDLAIRLDPTGSAAAVERDPAVEAPVPAADLPADPAARRASRRPEEDWATRWVVALATLAAVYRSRNAIRGLESKRRSAGLAGAGPAGPLASTVSQAHPAHGAVHRSHRGARAASPCR
jgi:methionine-rich copper-binding protein CopC